MIEKIKKIDIKHTLTEGIPIIGLITMIALFAIIVPLVNGNNFLSSNNIVTLINQGYLMMIACLASIFLFAQGGADISLQSNIALCSILAAYTIVDFGIIPAVVVSLLAGAIIGVINGTIYSRLGLMPFIVSMAMNLILDGLLPTIANKDAFISIPRSYQKMFGGLWFKLLILGIFFLLCFYLFRYTVFGKYSRAIGAGATATEQSGVNINRYKLLAFVFSGFGAGVYAIMAMLRTGNGSPSIASGVSFNVMIGMVLGGTTVTGGLAAKFRSCIIGAMMITVLTNAMTMLGLPSMAQEIIRGLLFVIVVVITYRVTDKVEGNRYIVRKKVKIIG